MPKFICENHSGERGLDFFLKFGKEISQKDLEDGSKLRLSENKNTFEESVLYSLSLLDLNQKITYHFCIDKLEDAKEAYDKINSMKRYMILPNQSRFRNIN